MSYIHVDWTAFAAEKYHISVRKKVDRELQKERIYKCTDSHFEGVDLDVASARSQAILQLLADQNCLFSAIKLGITLIEWSSDAWPIRSNYLAERYIFEAFEHWLAIQYVDEEKFKLQAFKQTSYFKKACFIAYELILRDKDCRLFCPEFILFIQDNLPPESEC